MSSSSPIRVLHVSLVDKDNYYLNNLVDFTPREEVVFSALTTASRGGFTEGLERRGVSTHALETPTRAQYGRALWRLAEVIGRESIDIVHAHLFDTTLLSLLAARLRGRRLVVTRHHSDALYRIPSTWKRRAYLAGEHAINRAADRVIAPSRMVRDILVERERVPVAKVALIPYGQTFERYAIVTRETIASIRRELGAEGAYLVVTVARLSEEKGHRYLLDAFQRFVGHEPRAMLALVGVGPLEAELKADAVRRGIGERVRFLGWRNDALHVTGAADLLAHPSLQEALPSAVIEALALERPVVATDVSGIRDLIGQSERGYLAPPHDADALLANMMAAHDRPDEAQARAKLGRAHVFAYLDPAQVAARHVELYRAVLGRA